MTNDNREDLPSESPSAEDSEHTQLCKDGSGWSYTLGA